MRRGHPGLGGWRSENPRQFRPRCGGTPHFRPPRKFSLLESPRFPPPDLRSHRGPHSYNAHLRHGPQDHHERNKYRDGNLQNNPRTQERGHYTQPRQIPPLMKPIRQNSIDPNNSYGEPSNFYDDVQIDQCHVNSMGDIDLRQSNNSSHIQDFYGHKQRQITRWNNPPPLLESRHHYYEDRSPPKGYRQNESSEGNKIPLLEYAGHRPPSSDHYVGNAGPIVNNNNSFSRSVDDTVDIVRKRLMNRNESQQSTEGPSIDQSSHDQGAREGESHQTQDEPPTKKRIQRQKHNAKSNCDKMKSKIVHQLFKMDKDKMHKLMDNPSSSTKFEYAISSLITESQNSLNRHLRSVAEKSLYSSSTDFIQNDNNTIYEDTFMKQMQCLLDPQDTIFLEDIKPLVMAELSKVLQLDEFEQKQDSLDNQYTQYSRDDQPNYSYYDEPYNYEEYGPQQIYDQDDDSVSNYENINMNAPEDSHNHEYNQQMEYHESKQLFERRPVKKESEYNAERRRSTDIERQRKSSDKPPDDQFNNSVEQLPLFNVNTEQLSEDDDPFAELDRQYHVAVDHNFIESDDISIKKEIISNNVESGNDILNSLKEEIDNQIQSIAKSPLIISRSNINDNEKPLNISSDNEHIQPPDYAKENSTSSGHSSNHDYRLEQTHEKQEHAAQSRETDKVIHKSDTTNTVYKSSTPSNTRKRSIDQRPSHRKEKRKKSESSQTDTNKDITDKGAHIKNNSVAKSTDEESLCHEATKPIVNLFFSKVDSDKEVLKDSKKAKGINKGYSDKYVKRKDTPKKEIELSNKKRTSSSSSHSNVSPKENNNATSHTYKMDPKTKLKTIDMFMEQPKKVSVHQAHRNTAPNTIVTVKTEENKAKEETQPLTVTNCKTVARHVGVQVRRKIQTRATQTFATKCISTRLIQTDRIKLSSKYVQTDPVFSDKPIPTSNDAFERMKQIDLEIQVLLQEKFKLYSSLESRDSCPSSMPTLGMTVLNVTSYDESKDSDEVDNDNVMSADAIVDEFTNIPVEELEQIALESVQEESDMNKVGKRSVVQKLQQERKSSESPTSTRRSNNKAKTPNISLLEQIITDDRPLEDIISLDDLEKPVKGRKRPPKSQPKRKPTKKAKPVKSVKENPFGLKDCYVRLMRVDIANYLKQLTQDQLEQTEEEVPDPLDHNATISESNVADELVTQVEHEEIEPSEIVEDTVVNDLQFDMLDVSEDIVIGDSCEIKCSEDKDHERVTINEEIILDNSQSSLDNAYADPGQNENVCKTYDYSTDENLRRDSVTVTGHADAVLAIECVENDFIAACLDGNVYHFSGDGQLLNTLRGSNLAVTCLTIVKEKYETIVYTGSLDSRIRYYDLETGLEKGPECNVLSPIQTMDRAWDTIFVGTRTGFVLQFECKNNMLIPVSTVKFSEQSILALRAMKEGPRKVLLVAARSENVTIKDAQTGLLLRTLVGPKMTVYTLLFEDGKVYCGTSSHQIHVFDYASGSHTACHEGGKGAVCLRATGGLLFAGCYDGCIYIYREGEPRPLAQLRGPSLMLLSLAIVGSKIIAGYKDRSLYIWKIPLSILQEMIL